MIISLQRRQLHGEVLAGVSRLVAVADAAATRQADEELEATAATRRAAWVQAVAALTSQRAAAEQARAAHKTLLSPRTCEPACEVVMPRLQVCLRGCKYDCEAAACLHSCSCGIKVSCIEASRWRKRIQSGLFIRTVCSDPAQAMGGPKPSLPAQVKELKGTTGRLEALYEECAADNRRLRTALACRSAEVGQMAQQAVALRQHNARLQVLLVTIEPMLMLSSSAVYARRWLSVLCGRSADEGRGQQNL